LARFAATAQAEGVSLPVARRLLLPLLEQDTPSVAQLGRWAQTAAQKAEAVLSVLDAVARPRVEQAAADGIFFGRRAGLGGGGGATQPVLAEWPTGRRPQRPDLGRRISSFSQAAASDSRWRQRPGQRNCLGESATPGRRPACHRRSGRPFSYAAGRLPRLAAN